VEQLSIAELFKRVILFQSVDDFGTIPRTAIPSADLEEEWKQNERPLSAKAIQKDRKRYGLIICLVFRLAASSLMLWSQSQI
jgi:hypothetical protein